GPLVTSWRVAQERPGAGRLATCGGRLRARTLGGGSGGLRRSRGSRLDLLAVLLAACGGRPLVQPRGRPRGQHALFRSPHRVSGPLPETDSGAGEIGRASGREIGGDWEAGGYG